MKILVDELPYDEEECLFCKQCMDIIDNCPIGNDDYYADECYYYKKMLSHQDYMDKLFKEIKYAMEDIYE